MEDFEKLGVFYLGREYDAEQGRRKDNLLLYESKDLLTHAVCVGMTGSGKTGLGVALLEEAAIDGIPAIVIDPKGDLANLLLTFPDLKPSDFLPWINEDDARKKGLTPAQSLAALEAALPDAQSARTVVDGPLEAEGPLAGLRGVLPLEGGLIQPARITTYSCQVEG